ncbi:MAG: glycosyltransferase [Candidatus Omnitrophica bacterium CG22_combo_CG10-13_8_21_14_all_43_16]|nr:MAG: glycosyltransferase [Candidatus Omnitrophica bacterium CG22_combo_CG10-13_8_21_14_all_43_16]
MIFVDGGSTDRSVKIASERGKVLSCVKGRAPQMNHGATCATYSTLLFLHSDNKIDLDALLVIEDQVNKKNIIGSCFTQRIDNDKIIYRLIETQGNIRARLSKVFYGDQGIFVKKDIFFKIGCFPNVPIMEDVLFTKKLRTIGKTKMLQNKIHVSSRRWDNGGIVKTTLRYNLINIAFKLAVSLEKIKLLYEDSR